MHINDINNKLMRTSGMKEYDAEVSSLKPVRSIGALHRLLSVTKPLSGVLIPMGDLRLSGYVHAPMYNVPLTRDGMFGCLDTRFAYRFRNNAEGTFHVGQIVDINLRLEDEYSNYYKIVDITLSGSNKKWTPEELLDEVSVLTVEGWMPFGC